MKMPVQIASPRIFVISPPLNRTDILAISVRVFARLSVCLSVRLYLKKQHVLISTNFLPWLCPPLTSMQ